MHFTQGVQNFLPCVLCTTLFLLPFHLLLLSIQFVCVGYADLSVVYVYANFPGLSNCKCFSLVTSRHFTLITSILNFIRSIFWYFHIQIIIQNIKTRLLARTWKHNMLDFANILITNILIIIKKLILTKHVQTLMRSWTNGIWPSLRFLTLELGKNMVRSNIDLNFDFEGAFLWFDKLFRNWGTPLFGLLWEWSARDLWRFGIVLDHQNGDPLLFKSNQEIYGTTTKWSNGCLMNWNNRRSRVWR